MTEVLVGKKEEIEDSKLEEILVYLKRIEAMLESLLRGLYGVEGK